MISRDQMARVIRDYYDGCNAADASKMIACFEPDAVHYFPSGAVQATLVGAEAIASGWRSAVEQLDSRWTIDHLLLDAEAQEAAIEWTHWKPQRGTHLRGVELVMFSKNGLISEIRAYYAAPSLDPRQTYQLGDFAYTARGYPVDPPQVTRNSTY